MNLTFKISYGLYVLSAKADGKDNGCMINTFAQQTSSPERYSVSVNKTNLTHDLIERTGECAVTVLANSTKFDLIKNFGMQSGAGVDKFAGIGFETTPSGIKVPLDDAIGYFDLKVEDSFDFGTHTMFLLSPKFNKVFEDAEPLTYAYYQSDVKPKPQAPVADKTERWVCKICGYVHEGPLPADYTCPICKHPASDFERIS